MLLFLTPGHNANALIFLFSKLNVIIVVVAFVTSVN